MKTVFVAALGAASLVSTASADFIGWTSNVRTVTGGYLVNVFAVVNNSTDVLLNVAGGSPGLPSAGYIRTNSAGGFRQNGTGSQSVFKPVLNQSWTTLDSFLTVGGDFSGGNFRGNTSTQGDPPWNVPTDSLSIDAFSTPSDPDAGFVNRYTNNVPVTAGWFLAGSAASALNLSVLTNRLYSSSAAAGSANAGMMVAQLFVSELSLAGSRELGKVIEWKMSATVRRLDGSTSNASFELVIGEVPAPGALAILGLAGLAARRRRA
jgi:MYXO-CTERM domain-containing protein